MQRTPQLPTWLGVVASVLAVVCEQMQQLLTTRKGACKRRTQQLPTLLRQQCWELLHPCWQWCANGCNNSQQCWDLQCIVGRTQPISLCKPCIMSVRGPSNVGGACANGSNIVALRFGDHGTKEMLGVVGQQCCTRLHGA